MDNNELEADYLQVDFASLIYCEGGLWGVRESELTCSLPTVYDSIECLNSSNCYIVMKDGLMGYAWLDENVNWLFDLVFTSIQQISVNRFLLCRDGKFFFWRDGKMTDWTADEFVLPNPAGWICVRRGEEWGYVDGDLNYTSDKSKAHEYIFPGKLFHKKNSRFLKRSDLDLCLEYYLKVTSGDVADEDTEKKYAELVDELVESAEFTIFEKNGKYGINDFLGHVAVKPIYDDIRWTPDDLPIALACKDGMWGVVACWGRVENEPQLIYKTIEEYLIYSNYEDTL